MRRKRRDFSVFSLSFLDVMSCGFGAIVLLFLILKHQIDVKTEKPDYDLSVEVEQLEQEIGEAQEAIGRQRSAVMDLDEEIAAARARTALAHGALAAARAAGGAPIEHVSAAEVQRLRAERARLENEKRQLEAQIHERSRSVRTFHGEGEREYLTGIKLGGQRILILLDASASMLDDTIVNVIRRRNMDDAAKRRSAKWRQALAIVDWISARFPAASHYQIYTFNEQPRPVLANTGGRWLAVADLDQINRAVAELKRVIPDGGTSLERAFMAAAALTPQPDNVFLITDGLPTQGLEGARGTTVSGRERMQLFEAAVTRIPRGVPVNIVLLPMEGDPMAASAFWQVALFTAGSFLTPARDWP